MNLILWYQKKYGKKLKCMRCIRSKSQYVDWCGNPAYPNCKLSCKLYDD